MTGTNKKQLFGIFAFCVSAMAGNLTMGIIAYIMQSYPNVAPTTVAQILTMPALVGTAYAFCVGVLHKKIPAKYLLMFSQACLFLYGMLFLFAGGKAPIGVLLFAAGLAGIGMGSNNTLLAIVLSEAVPDPDKRGGVLGICMAVMNVGGVFFSTVGGMLAVGHWNNAYYLFFALLITLPIQLLCLPKGAIQAAPIQENAQNKVSAKLPLKVWLIAINYFLFFLALYVYGLNISEYIITTYKLGTSAEAGLASSMVTIGGIVAGAFFGVYSTKFLKKFTVPVLMGMCVIGIVIPIIVTTNVFALYFCGLILGFAMSGCNPYIMQYLGVIAPGELYSKALSIFSGFMNAGMCVAVTVLAFLAKLICGDGSDVPTKFVVGAILAAVAFVTSFPIYLGKDKT